jgi:hypothetical protein
MHGIRLFDRRFMGFSPDRIKFRLHRSGFKARYGRVILAFGISLSGCQSIKRAMMERVVPKEVQTEFSQDQYREPDWDQIRTKLQSVDPNCRVFQNLTVKKVSPK